MEKKLVLSISDDPYYRENDDMLSVTSSDSYDIVTVGIINEKDSIIDIFSNKERILDIAKQGLDIYADTGFLEIWNTIIDKIDNLFDEFEYVSFDLMNTNFIDLINNNPELKTKKVALRGVYSINDKENLLEMKGKYKDFDLYVDLDNNSNYVSIDDCLKTIDYIKTLSDHIKSLNLSSIEKIMYVFDVVKKNIYKEVEDGEEKSISRDLSSVLFQDNIVCVGYANIVDAILNGLEDSNITSRLYNLENLDDEIDHIRNQVYVKDDKYKINGVYFFDATWCSRESNDDEDYINDYSFFAKTFKEMKDIDMMEEFNFDYKEDKYFSKNFIQKMLSISHKKDRNSCTREVRDFYSLFSIVGLKLKNIISFTFDFFQNDKKAVDKLNRDYRKVKYLFDRPLFAEQFLEILKNVRLKQIEEELDPKYYTVEEFLKAYECSDFSLEKKYYSLYEKFVGSIFGYGSLNRSANSDFYEYCNTLQIPEMERLSDKQKVKKIETQ